MGFFGYGSLAVLFPGLIDDLYANRASVWEHINFVGGNCVCYLVFSISFNQKNFGLGVA